MSLRSRLVARPPRCGAGDSDRDTARPSCRVRSIFAEGQRGPKTLAGASLALLDELVAATTRGTRLSGDHLRRDPDPQDDEARSGGNHQRDRGKTRHGPSFNLRRIFHSSMSALWRLGGRGLGCPLIALRFGNHHVHFHACIVQSRG